MTERMVRTPPHNIEIEAALIGALLTDNRLLQDCDFLDAMHFYDPLYRAVYPWIGAIVDEGNTATPLTVAHRMDDKGLQVTLTDLVTTTWNLLSVADWAEVVRDLYLRRELIVAGESMIADGYDGQIKDNADKQIENAELVLYQLRPELHGHGPQDLKHYLDNAMDTLRLAVNSKGDVTGLPTGIATLDAKIGGLQKTDLIVLAGRPGMGKSALALTIAGNVAAGGGSVLFFSVEMSGEQLAQRLQGAAASISVERLRRGRISADELAEVDTATRNLKSYTLHIDPTPAITVAAIRSRARRHARRHGLSLVVIDYLQLMSASNQAKRMGSRQAEVSEITAALKSLAKELNVPVLALSQLSRATEMRDDKRPQLSDLRESGAIEQDADIVSFIFREEYYLEQNKPQRKENESEDRFAMRSADWVESFASVRNVAEIIVAKHRHGPTGTVKLYFNPSEMKFDSLGEG